MQPEDQLSLPAVKTKMAEFVLETSRKARPLIGNLEGDTLSEGQISPAGGLLL